MGTRVEIRRATDISGEEQRQLDWPWDISDEPDYVWTDPDWRVLVWVKDQVVSQLGIVERVCSIGERRVKLGGVGGVIALPEWRGQGLTTAAMKETARFICDELEVEFGLLLCREFVVSFYQALGWQVVKAPVLFDQPGGKAIAPMMAMVLPCRGQEWPRGVIDLCGLPW
jgi:GNAT superfamily N-acetyltransferase